MNVDPWEPKIIGDKQSQIIKLQNREAIIKKSFNQNSKFSPSKNRLNEKSVDRVNTPQSNFPDLMKSFVLNHKDTDPSE